MVCLMAPATCQRPVDNVDYTLDSILAMLCSSEDLYNLS